MRPSRGFRPSESWSLEDRVALSHNSAVAHVAQRAAGSQVEHATFQGPYTTTVQSGVDTLNASVHLTASAPFPTVGTVSLDGSLSNNVVFPRRRSRTQGTFTFESQNFPGQTVVLSASGPYANLAPTRPTTIRLTVTVASAPALLGAYIGKHGNAVLTLVPNGATSSGTLTHTSAGSFTLVLSGKVPRSH